MKKINEGGWSKIYLGMDIQTNEEVAVKVNLEQSMNDLEYKIMK